MYDLIRKGPHETTSAGGVSTPRLSPKRPAFHTASHRAAGKIATDDTAWRKNAWSAAKVKTTLPSGVALSVGSPPLASRSTAASAERMAGSMVAAKVKMTSAALTGEPSDQRSPGRNSKVHVRPSSERSHNWASKGSIRNDSRS